MSATFLSGKNIIDVIKYKWVCIVISALLIIPGIVSMVYSSMTLDTHSPMRLGIDFTGGTIMQYGFEKKITKEDISKTRLVLEEMGIENPVLQVIENPSRTKDAKIDHILSIRTRHLKAEKNNNEQQQVDSALREKMGNVELLQINAIGPTLGKELFKNSVVAMLLVFIAIVAYLTIRFQLDYAIFALFALFHDTLFVCGVFSLLGLFYGVQIDSLFITAILTVIGFSVHDTIVVFDRIRENARFLSKKKTFNEIVNASVNQTLARSINTSITSIITLLALYIWGGVTTKDFVLAMILGIAIGTYSSIFFASMFLAAWRGRKNSKKVKA